MSRANAHSYSLGDYYWTSVGVGLRGLAGRYRRDAAARIINPLSYPRYLEYQLAVDQLDLIDACRILDIGSPKLPVVVLARGDCYELYATDIRDYFIGPTAYFLNSIGLGHSLGHTIHLHTQDARCLSYEDASFDRVFSISVFEHIPDNGDTLAMREVKRILRPGGIFTMTVPFSAAGYREEYVNGRVYERAAVRDGTFYQRHYDLPALQARLIDPSGLRLLEAVFFGEPRVRFERFWNRIPMRWKLPLLWTQPLMAKLFLKRLSPDRLDAACGVALKFTKLDAPRDPLMPATLPS